MNLQFKHLAPYLPYGLKMYCPDDDWEKYQTLTGLSLGDGLETTYTKEHVHDYGTTSGNYYAFKGSRNYAFYNVKCILRPLKDLHQPFKILEINPKVTLTYLNELCLLADGSVHEDDWVNHMLDFSNNLGDINFEQCPYHLIQKLFEWKFDVLDLIDTGAAVDINTLTGSIY